MRNNEIKTRILENSKSENLLYLLPRYQNILNYSSSYLCMYLSQDEKVKSGSFQGAYSRDAQFLKLEKRRGDRPRWIWTYQSLKLTPYSAAAFPTLSGKHKKTELWLVQKSLSPPTFTCLTFEFVFNRCSTMQLL